MPEHNVVFRQMTEADLQSAMYVRKYAGEDLARTEGRAPWIWQPGVGSAQRHILATDPDGSWVADINGMVVGFSQGFVRGDIWFLSQLFVHPEVHSSGFGQELLRRAQNYGRERGASVFSVVSSTSPVAQSLYMRAGMFAFAVGYRLVGSIERLLDLSEPAGGGEIAVDCSGWQDEIAQLDRATFGVERREDHAYYLDATRNPIVSASFAMTRQARLAGYAYASNQGFIAPVAAYEPEDQLPLVRACAESMREHEVTDGSIWVVSHNQTLVGALLARGWMVTNWSFLKANRPFGKFDRYHPAGGILL